jgi:hypothetical protein
MIRCDAGEIQGAANRLNPAGPGSRPRYHPRPPSAAKVDRDMWRIEFSNLQEAGIHVGRTAA